MANHMTQMLRVLMVTTPIAFIVGCGGGGSENVFAQPPSSTATKNGTSGTDAASGDNTSTASYFLGKGIGSTFIAGSLEVGLADLPAGGSTSVSATIADSKGNLATGSFTVNFSSPCSAKNLATITPSVSTSSGIASATYIAKGCSGQDPITAITTINGQTLSATGAINVQPATLGSVQFVSAEPALIALKGMGGVGMTTSSTLRFRVLNDVGGPAVNQDVDFRLSTDVGGIKLNPVRGKTDADGYVQTVVEAGSVHTSVRVTASIPDTSISTQSSSLAIGTGIPDQNSFSISIETLNPEAYDYDGATVKATVHAFDRYNNPVADGTSIAFYSEYGGITGSCETLNGSCSATWTSGGERPSDGRTTITAVAIGEESFLDNNSNGIFDAGDTLLTDTGDAFEDYNENGSFNQGTDKFIDNDNDGFTSPDGLYTGVLCQHPSLCSGKSLKSVFDSAVLVMAESNLEITDNLNNGSMTIPHGGTQAFTVTIGGARTHQVPPAGTTISFKSDSGKVGPITSYTVPSTNANQPLTFNLFYTGEGKDTGEGTNATITIEATTPKGMKNSRYISVTELAANQSMGPTFNITGATIREGNSGSSTLTLNVSLNQALSELATVDFETQDGTASVADFDYVTNSGTLSFDPGETLKTITLTINGDIKSEADESFRVILKNPTKAILGTSEAVAVILNDDSASLPTVSLSTTPTSVIEGNSGATPAVFTVSLSGEQTNVVTVDYATTPGTANTSDADYAANTGSLVFAAGETSKQIEVLVTGDTRAEGDEIFYVNLSNPSSNITLGNSRATGVIRNDDPAQTPTIGFALSNVNVTEGQDSKANATFNVQLSQVMDTDVSVDYVTEDRTATTADGDYIAQAGSILFTAGTTQQSVNVVINGDLRPEGDEAFAVTLSNPSSGVQLSQSMATATIINDDSATLPTVSIETTPVIVKEDTATASLNVTLSEALSTNASVDFKTTDDTAKANSDYTGLTGSVVFAAGETRKTITINLNRDTVDEADERFDVTLSNPTPNVMIGNRTGTVLILDNDP